MPTIRSRPSRAIEEVEVSSASVPLGHAARTISRYRYPIATAIVGILLLYSIVAITLYLLSPSQRIITLPFRLEFEGAERGQYPNGTKFSSSEIIATPILTRVYQANTLSRFLSFQEFSSAVFIIESNRSLEQLAREYEAKLSDPKLSAVDRERLENEYQLKRESVSRSEYSINFASPSNRLPQRLTGKILSDILAGWARSAAEEKGVSLYRIPVLTKNVLPASLVNLENPFIALDVLRTRAETVIRNINGLLTVPGAEVLRTPGPGLSLGEIRLQLGDSIRFKIQPLIARLRSSGAVADSQSTIRYLESQHDYNELQARSAESKVEALRRSLELYTEQSATTGVSVPSPDARAQNDQTPFTPQISETFLDRLVELTRRSDDLEYRQNLVDQLTNASYEGLPYRHEAQYYSTLLREIRSAPGTRGSGPSRAEIATQLSDIYGEILRSIDSVSVIYRLLSRNLNPSTTLYTLTGPLTARTERSLTFFRLAFYGLLVALFAIPLTMAAALLLNRIREEEELEDMMVDETRGRQEAEVRPAQEFSSGPAAR